MYMPNAMDVEPQIYSHLLNEQNPISRFFALFSCVTAIKYNILTHTHSVHKKMIIWIFDLIWSSQRQQQKIFVLVLFLLFFECSLSLYSCSFYFLPHAFFHFFLNSFDDSSLLYVAVVVRLESFFSHYMGTMQACCCVSIVFFIWVCLSSSSS